MAEFARPVRIDTLGAAPRTEEVEASEVERAALAARFALISIERLAGGAALRLDGDTVIAEGRLQARATQACVATGEPVAATIDEPFALRFVPGLGSDEAEDFELDEGDLDTVLYEGGAVDLGEAIAQTFALALDPFPRAPGADAHLRAAGVLSEEEADSAKEAASPFAMLRKKD